jgi:hypothetical protein
MFLQHLINLIVWCAEGAMGCDDEPPCACCPGEADRHVRSVIGRMCPCHPSGVTCEQPPPRIKADSAMQAMLLCLASMISHGCSHLPACMQFPLQAADHAPMTVFMLGTPFRFTNCSLTFNWMAASPCHKLLFPDLSVGHFHVSLSGILLRRLHRHIQLRTFLLSCLAGFPSNVCATECLCVGGTHHHGNSFAAYSISLQCLHSRISVVKDGSTNCLT